MTAQSESTVKVTMPASPASKQQQNQYANVEQFVKENGGTTPIKKVLIANNGISAVKAIRSIRRWSYETFSKEREIRFVAMATPEDLMANAEYIRMADEFVEVPGGSNVNNYANVTLIVNLAERYSVDAVFAGWGHASENPALPNTLDKKGIVFIGPPGPPMHALGDKIGSTIIAQSAKVPTIAWNGQELTFSYKDLGHIPEEMYAKANILTVQECLAQVKRIGLPVMIKASEGGGGKGIRKVTNLDQVEAAFRQVQGEIPGSPIFVMKLAPRSRHLEVQLLADKYGNAIALSGRDCSVQRRHQKIIEEGPPLAPPPHVWDEMCKAAVRLAKEVGYVNAGTVEYLYMPNGEFFFLELNPRLQVEHPVTEMITHVNLPAAQIQVAMGVPLNRISDIRELYNLDPNGDSKVDFDNEIQRAPEGHVVAARITAENPNDGFTPTSGKIQELNFRSSRNVWGYFSVDSSGRVHEFADSQIGHIFAWGANREIARRNLAIALNDLSIRGEIRTTVEYLKDMIECTDFKENNLDTTWLDDRIKNYVQDHKIDPLTVVLCGAGCHAYANALKNEADYMQNLERGQIPPPTLLDQQFKDEIIYQNVKYTLTISRSGPNTFVVTNSNSSTYVEQEVRTLADGGYLVIMGGKSHVSYIKEEVGAERFIVDGQTCLFVEEYDPTCLRAQMGGKLLRFLVDDNAKITKGTPFAEIEVMKMNMPLVAKESGVIKFCKTAGAVMEPGDILCTMVLDDPSKVQKAQLFTENLPAMGEPWPKTLGNMKHQQLVRATDRLEHVMKGYLVQEEACDKALALLQGALVDPLLPELEVQDILSVIKNKLPLNLTDEIISISDTYRKDVLAIVKSKSFSSVGEGQQTTESENNDEINNGLKLNEMCKAYIKSIRVAITGYASKMEQQPREELLGTFAAPILTMLNKFQDGMFVYSISVVTGILQKYVTVEKQFYELELSDAAEKDDVLQELRREYADNLVAVYELSLAHSSTKLKNRLALSLLQHLESIVRREEMVHSKVIHITPNTSDTHKLQVQNSADEDDDCQTRKPCVDLLLSIASIGSKSTSEVALEARQLLIELQQPSYNQSLNHIKKKLMKVNRGDEEASKHLIESTEAILHMLIDIISNSEDPELKATALLFYIKRVYQAYNYKDLELNSSSELGQFVSFNFHSESKDAAPMSGLTGAQSMDDLTAMLAGTGTAFNDLVSSKSVLSEESDLGLDIDRQSSDGADRARFSSVVDHEATMPGSGQVPKKKTPLRTMDSVAPFVNRHALLGFYGADADMAEWFNKLLSQLPKPDARSANAGPVNALHVIIASKTLKTLTIGDDAGGVTSDGMNCDVKEEDVAAKLSNFLKQRSDKLKLYGVRRVTFAVAPDHGKRTPVVAGHGSGLYTFRNRSHYEEDRLVRHIETPLAFQLDLGRLANFNIQLVPLGKNMSMSNTVHVYRAVPKERPRGARGNVRYFVRALVRQTAQVEKVASHDAYPGPERILVQAIAALEAVQDGSSANVSTNNHIFLNVLGDAVVEPEFLSQVARVLTRRYAKRLAAAQVSEVELKVNAMFSMDTPTKIPVRLVACNPTGFALKVDSYVEASDPVDPSQSIFYSISDGDGGLGSALAAMGLGDTIDYSNESGAQSWVGDLHGMRLTTPYPISKPFEEKRLRARNADTQYVYDFPELFRKSVELEWRKYCRDYKIGKPASVVPSTLVKVDELIMSEEIDATDNVDEDSGLCYTTRAPGNNTVSMVAWLMTVFTPEYPNGRKLVVIANDITLKAGSFGTGEDDLFLRASKYARKLGLPRLYIAANSGARIGMADEVKRCFKIKFTDPKDESKGFDYIYLTPEDHKLLGADGLKSVITEKIMVNGQAQYKITDIVGEGRDLGVENLRGSGMIAGETSRAYDDTFTITYVSGRTVGIGAYLVRLGQRTIQKGTNAPILLTGYSALNSLMGSNVYTSNLQLGGPKIMYNNGVSHICVRNDLEGVSEMVHWLSYIPEHRGAVLPSVKLLSDDSLNRLVEYKPDAGVVTDPRLMLTGVETSDGWQSGFFDKGSFTETLAGWAKTVIVGRARLGTIPVGCIISETRTVSAKAPADPATPDSKERLWNQAGQVWFPDSAYKTAQAIKDFNNEELPLMLFANWRGFSGGQRDMFDEVLKYGAFIVDELVAYKQPIFIYIPPYGELRGGAWVVVDPTINEVMMEMYAAPEARGNVLEPSGAVSIKFRLKDIIAAAHRVDEQLIALDKKLSSMVDDSSAEAVEIQKQIKEREAKLVPIYKQIALHFGDLHDTPGRMHAKGVIRKCVDWAESRRYFVWRLKRRLAEVNICKEIKKKYSKEFAETMAELQDMFAEQQLEVDNDIVVLNWLQSRDGVATVEAKMKQLNHNRIVEQVTEMGLEDSRAVLKGIMTLISKLTEQGKLAEKDSLLHTLRVGSFLMAGAGNGALERNRSDASNASLN